MVSINIPKAQVTKEKQTEPHQNQLLLFCKWYYQESEKTDRICICKSYIWHMTCIRICKQQLQQKKIQITNQKIDKRSEKTFFQRSYSNDQ